MPIKHKWTWIHAKHKISQIPHDSQPNSSTNQEEKIKRMKKLTLVTREWWKFDEERLNENEDQRGEKEELNVGDSHEFLWEI